MLSKGQSTGCTPFRMVRDRIYEWFLFLYEWFTRVVVPRFLDDYELMGHVPNTTRFHCALHKVRPVIVFICILLVFVWVTADYIWLDGMVPGARDSFITQSQPFNGKERENIIDWHRKPTTGVSYSCTCSFKPGATVLGAPYALLQVANKQPVIQPRQIWGYCADKTAVPPVTDQTTDGDLTRSLARRFMLQIGQAVIAAPFTTSLLTLPAWQMARFNEAQRAVNLAAQSAKAELQLGVQNTSEAEKHVAQLIVFETAYLAFFAKLLMLNISDVPHEITDEGVIGVFDPHTGQLTSEIHINCNVSGVLPFSMAEFCCQSASTGVHNHSAASCLQAQPGCPDAYNAYLEWCNPAMCHELKGKGRYLQAVQILAAFGGLCGMLNLLFVITIWNVFVLGWCAVRQGSFATAAGTSATGATATSSTAAGGTP